MAATVDMRGERQREWIASYRESIDVQAEREIVPCRSTRARERGERTRTWPRTIRVRAIGPSTGASFASHWASARSIGHCRDRERDI